MAEQNAQLKELAQQVENLQAKLAACQEAQKRSLADYHNLLRRTTEEKRAITADANRELLSDLLPTLDHLNLAVDHQPDSVLSMITAQLQRALSKHGLERLWVRNKQFDPQLMEAAGTAPGPKDQVVREEQSGYELNGKILRHARVVVGTGEKTVARGNPGTTEKENKQ